MNIQTILLIALAVILTIAIVVLAIRLAVANEALEQEIEDRHDAEGECERENQARGALIEKMSSELRARGDLIEKMKETGRSARKTIGNLQIANNRLRDEVGSLNRAYADAGAELKYADRGLKEQARRRSWYDHHTGALSFRVVVIEPVREKKGEWIPGERSVVHTGANLELAQAHRTKALTELTDDQLTKGWTVLIEVSLEQIWKNYYDGDERRGAAAESPLHPSLRVDFKDALSPAIQASSQLAAYLGLATATPLVYVAGSDA